MVVIEQLRISPDGQKLFIDAHINKSSYFENLVIDKISIDTQNTVLQSFDGPSENPVFTHSTITNTLRPKEVHLVVDKNMIDADLSKDMLYVYFHVSGTPSSNTPCGLDSPYTLGVTFNEGIIYNRMMGYTKEITNTCEIPMGFIDMILQLEAIKAAIETENYVTANKFYNRLINLKSSSTSNINCKCYG